jgi:hypothetical protein
MRGYALKKSTFHPRTIALYMLGNGVNRRVIDEEAQFPLELRGAHNGLDVRAQSLLRTHENVRIVTGLNIAPDIGLLQRVSIWHSAFRAK